MRPISTPRRSMRRGWPRSSLAGATIKPVVDASAIAARDGRSCCAPGCARRSRVDVDQDDKAPDHLHRQGVANRGSACPIATIILNDDRQAGGDPRPPMRAYLAKLLTLAGEADADARAARDLRFRRPQTRHGAMDAASRAATPTRPITRWARADLPRKAPGFDWTRLSSTAAGVDRQRAFDRRPAQRLYRQRASSSRRRRSPCSRTICWSARSTPMRRICRSRSSMRSSPFTAPRCRARRENRAALEARRVAGHRARSARRSARSMSRAISRPRRRPRRTGWSRTSSRRWTSGCDKLDWMAPETKAKARAKLAAFTPQDRLSRQVARLFGAGDRKRRRPVGNDLRAEEFEWQRNLAKLGKPVDRGEWGMTPMTINAYANPTMDEIVFPAAILQPPFFDPNADPAVNYGGDRRGDRPRDEPSFRRPGRANMTRPAS